MTNQNTFNIDGNPTEEQELVFDSTSLNECLDYFDENGDIEPLRNAVSHNSRKIRNLNDKLTLLITVAKDVKNDYFANQLQQIKDTLKN